VNWFGKGGPFLFLQGGGSQVSVPVKRDMGRNDVQSFCSSKIDIGDCIQGRWEHKRSNIDVRLVIISLFIYKFWLGWDVVNSQNR